MKNKIFIKFICILFIISVFISQSSANAINLSLTNKNYSEIEQSYKNFIAIELYSFLQKNSGSINVFNKDYAGAFIDENDVLNICLLDISNKEIYEEMFEKGNVQNISSKILSEMVSKDNTLTTDILSSLRIIANNITVKYNISTFSFEYLEEIEDVLKPNMSGFGMKALFIDQSDNLVYIYVSNEDCIGKINEYLSNRIKQYDFNAVKFIIDDFNITNTATYYAYGGRELSISAGEGTVGFNAIDSDGNFGIVSCGHSLGIGTKVYNENNKKIGTVTKSSFGSTIDASFTPFNNTLFVNWQETHYISYPGSSIYPCIASVASSNKFVEGARVERYGIATNKTVGTIVIPSVNIDGGSNNPSYTNAFMYSNAPSLGDSGGPVILSTGTPKSLKYLAGINSAYMDLSSYGRVGIGSKATDILNSFNLTALTSENCID